MFGSILFEVITVIHAENIIFACYLKLLTINLHIL